MNDVVELAEAPDRHDLEPTEPLDPLPEWRRPDVRAYLWQGPGFYTVCSRLPTNLGQSE